MKTVMSITEVRKRLPSIVKSLKTSPEAVYQVTVHDEIVAEIKRPPAVKPGEAAAKLLELSRKLRRRKTGYKIPISENIKEHLYVAEDND